MMRRKAVHSCTTSSRLSSCAAIAVCAVMARVRSDAAALLHVAAAAAASVLLGVTLVALTFDSTDPTTAATYYRVMLASRVVRIFVPAACVTILADAIQGYRAGGLARRHAVRAMFLLFGSLAIMLAVVKPAEKKLVASGGSAHEDTMQLRVCWSGHLVVCCIQLVALRLHIGALAGLAPMGPWAVVRAHKP